MFPLNHNLEEIFGFGPFYQVFDTRFRKVDCSDNILRISTTKTFSKITSARNYFLSEKRSRSDESEKGVPLKASLTLSLHCPGAGADVSKLQSPPPQNGSATLVFALAAHLKGLERFGPFDLGPAFSLCPRSIGRVNTRFAPLQVCFARVDEAVRAGSFFSRDAPF
ncbi:hypothetical protein CEXT_430271 [Caerostris extrusa]|uniref:Uncharacterized protein n=1 Tax=Caerostris extrusa TaxID=172846 RepID=A0AAV4XWY7_CAEEX|nr:hypothetical protein CEXT_430271 [Caerostris extrusa]